MASTQNDRFVPSSGIQQGTWRRAADGQIISTQVYFVYGPTGFPTGTVKVRSIYNFSDADNFTGSGQQLLCDLAVSNCTLLPGIASLQGTRVQVEEIVGP